MVEEALACGKHHVVNIRVYHLCERAVALHVQLQVGAVAAYHIHQGIGQFVAVHLVYPALHGLYYLRFLKAVYVVPASAVASVRREVAAVMRTFEGHSKVVSIRFERISRVFKHKFLCPFVHLGYVYVESAETFVPVRREVKVAVWPECREHLVARRVDRFAQILHASKSVARKSHSPNVVSSFSSRHVRCEVEPLSVGRYGRMGIARQCVACYLEGRSLAPCCVRAVRCYNGCISRIVRVGSALCEIHLTLVRRKAACALVKLSVEA